MKIPRPFIVALLLVATSQASAQAYKCLGATGKIEYRDSPCTSTQTVEKTFNQVIAPSDADRISAIDRAGRQTKEERENTPGSAGQQLEHEETTRRPVANQSASASAPHPAVVSGGICTESFSWDTCRKLGVDSVVDCKRLDEDVVFRTSVLQSKGIQCKYSHRR